MTINGKQKEIKNADLIRSAKHMGLGVSEAEKIIEEVSRSISSWKLYAEKAGLREENARAIEKEISLGDGLYCLQSSKPKTRYR